jgi:hypothetical protein
VRGDISLCGYLLSLPCTEWFTLNHRDRYCGEVYLELTFWSNVRNSTRSHTTSNLRPQAPAPQKKPAPVSQKIKQEYGGTGEFTPLHDEPPSDDFGRLDAYMETIRPSNSTSRMPLYMPSYEPRGGNPSGSVDQLVNDFGELVVHDHSRRSSTYPVRRKLSIASTPSRSYSPIASNATS